jgi:hypothetical protein
MATDQSRAPTVRQQHLRTYHTWKAMRNRCRNPRNPSWRYYGGKGVRVCDRWDRSFAAFLADMGPRPSPAHSIDRFPDRNGNYEPGNCRWATSAEQQENTSKVTYLAFRGETLPVHVWSRRFGIPANTLKSRLNELGWDAERSLTTPVNESMSRTKRPPRPAY